MGNPEDSRDRRRRDDAWDADRIRSLRRHAGLSQRALADELNARQQTISEWERGEYTPRGTAARLLTRVAEDVEFPFESGASEHNDSDEADSVGADSKHGHSDDGDSDSGDSPDDD